MQSILAESLQGSGPHLAPQDREGIQQADGESLRAFERLQCNRTILVVLLHCFGSLLSAP